VNLLIIAKSPLAGRLDQHFGSDPKCPLWGVKTGRPPTSGFFLDAAWVAEPTQGSSADPDCSAAESIQFRLAFTAGLTHVREAETAAVAL
jgi:hypothetical protein